MNKLLITVSQKIHILFAQFHILRAEIAEVVIVFPHYYIFAKDS